MLFGFGIPKKSLQPPTFSWRPFIVFVVVLGAALGLRAYQWIRGPVVPTADVPAITWEEVVPPEEGTIVPEQEDTSVIVEAEEIPLEVPDSEQDPLEEIVLPEAINLAVPFTSQAPYGIWDAFTEETCEEASFAMALAYYAGEPEGTLDPAQMDADFHAMVSMEESFGFGVSISSAQFVEFAQAYNGSSVRVVENPTADDLRAFLAAGNPVIVPAYGRKLGNPFFTGEGPLYHMLVLRGYTSTTFITNDPGTRHGENYQYSVEILMNAIGDWDGDSPDGGIRVMVLEP